MNSKSTIPKILFDQEQAFLLRSWQDDDGQWRFNVQTVGSDYQRIGFPTLDALLNFLQSSFEGEKHETN